MTVKKKIIFIALLIRSLTILSQSNNSNQIVKVSKNKDHLIAMVTIINDSTPFLGSFQTIQNCTTGNTISDTTFQVGINKGINNFKIEVKLLECQELNIAFNSMYDSLYFNSSNIISLEEKLKPTINVQYNKLKILNPTPLDTYSIEINKLLYFRGIINQDSIILLDTNITKGKDSIIEISSNNKTISTIYYNKNTFSLLQNKKNIETDTIKRKRLSFHGSTSLMHMNGAKNQPNQLNNTIPNTQITSSNKLILFNIPLNIDFQFNNAKSIDKNFRSYFNISLDKTEFQKSLKNLKNKTIQSKKQDLNNQISNLEDQKKHLNESRNNTLGYNDSVIKHDLNIPTVDTGLTMIDTFEVKKSINEIQSEIDLLNNSIRTLEQKEKLDSKYNPINSLNFFEKIDHFEIGNFYEVITPHTLSNVEIKGINLKLSINSKQSIHILSGRKNKYYFNPTSPSMFSSIGYINTHFSKLNFSTYVSLDQKKQVETTNDYIISQIFEGHLSKKLEYKIETNILIKQDLNNYQNHSASIGELQYLLFKNISLNVGLEAIGKEYSSDGVFLLQNDLFSKYIKTNVNLFKNKISLSASYNDIERNKSSQSLENKRISYSLEATSRFQKIPNIYYSIKPINFELFSQLDTNLFKVSINSTIEITRLTYSKRIKSTFYKVLLSRTNIVTKSNLSDSEVIDNRQTNYQLLSFISFNKNNLSVSINSLDNLQSFSSLNIDLSNSFNDKFSSSLGFMALFDTINKYGLRLITTYQINKIIASNIGINSFDNYISINLGFKITY